MSADDKKLILARRARFVAAALAGVSVACGKEPTEPPRPCLSVPIQRDAEPEPPPQPCLTPVAYDPDAEPPAARDAGAPVDAGASTDAGTTTRAQQPDAATPVPCLSPPLPTNTSKPQPPPRPCLSVVKPPDGQKSQ